MIWLSWRQQRTETLLTAAILAALGATFIPAGIHLADLFAQEHLAQCVNSHSPGCVYEIGSFVSGGGVVAGLFDGGWFNLIPGLIGVALAAPLLLDLENGTTRLAWTQSVTRGRWLATRLGLAAGSALVAAAGFSVLFTWYQRPFDQLFGRWDKFDFEGIVPLGYTLFALGLALAVGVLLKRGMAALVIAYGLYVAARLFVQSWLRQRLMTPLSATWGPHGSGPNVSSAWVISEGPSDKAGHAFHGNALRLLQSCVQSHPFQAVGPKGGTSHEPACMTRLGAGYTHILYQPGSRFWEFQGLEFSLFAGVALVLLAFAAWRVLRTD